MKKYYVYELVNQKGKVEYIGYSCDLTRRLYQHTKVIGPGMGKFYGRTDLSIKPVKECSTRKEAFKSEGEYKIKKGFDWSEKIGQIKGAYNLGKKYGHITGKENAINSQGHSINVYEYKTNKFINSFRSLGEASRELDLHKQGIVPCLKGKNKQYKGYTFTYA